MDSTLQGSPIGKVSEKMIRLTDGSSGQTTLSSVSVK